MMTLVTATAVSVWYAFDARQARQLSKNSLYAEKVGHEEAPRSAARAEANLSKALKAVDTLLDETTNELLLDQPGMTAQFERDC